MHPIVLAVLEHDDCDDRLVNEVYGFVMRCAAQSGAHLTDYLVSRGTAVQMAGPSRVEELLAVAVAAGYLTVVDVDGRRAYKIHSDPEFIHLRLREEVEWERQRKQDNSNPALTMPVRFRDGDACRYCLRVVNWDTKKGGLSGTYDHLVPKEAATVDTYVVACRSCNAQRGDDPDSFQYKLQPEPCAPYYSPKTIKWFAENEWAARNGYVLPARTRNSRKVIKPGDVVPGAQSGTTPMSSSALAAEAPSAGPRPSTQPALANLHATRDALRLQHASDDAPRSAPAGPRPGTQPALANHDATRDCAPSAEHSSQNADTVTPETRSDPHEPVQPAPPVTSANTVSAETARKWPETAEREGTGFTLTGRVGSGRDGTGRDGSSSSSTPARHRSKPGHSPPRRRGGRRHVRNQSAVPQDQELDQS